ncbi:arylsulfatase B [Nilaparvata lugens]|uniref:arylsulfatase B n=1 Tax=Nilaparvata lugens TaxID=108931 RepID=UPI00193CD007|nr:arylsulfatase B [Nilaparvata lugens]
MVELSVGTTPMSVALLIIASLASAVQPFRPNIVMIIADDLGWNDVGFHGSDQIPTPNLDALAFNGVILNNHYVQPQCTPSRAALMTGRYPIKTGMQGPPLLAAEPRGLPLSYKILPQYMRDLGYSTHAVGKWHLGYYRRDYTPQYRGFDTHLGYYGGFTSYYDYILQDIYPEGEFTGFDLRRNGSIAYDLQGRYATDVYTEEAVNVIHSHPVGRPLFLYVAHLAVHAGNRGKLLEAPQEVINRFQHIVDPQRRTYAAMVAKLDESVGEIVSALHRRSMLDNTIIVFMSDNGAPATDNQRPNIGLFPNWGSNYPLRGAKETLWEGGIRSPSFIWSTTFQQSPRVSTNLMHITDWLPTLYAAAGGDKFAMPPDIDGVDHWYSLQWKLPSPRKQALLNINERDRNAAIITSYETGISRNTWKMIFGKFKNHEFDEYYQDTKSPTNPTYNVQEILASPAGRALATLYPPSATDYTIRNSRFEATVNCGVGINYPAPNCEFRPCLFNLDKDPCERLNVADHNTAITIQMYNDLRYFRSMLIPQSNRGPDIYGADPKKWNDTWQSWAL